MAKLPCIHFYPGDWLRDQVSGCSMAAQGLWLRMMMLAHDTDRYGYLSNNGVALPPGHIAARCGIPLEQYTTLLAELDSVGVPRRTPDGIIFSKRMAEDAKLRGVRAKAGAKGGKQKSSKTQANAKQNPEVEDDLEDEVEDELPEELRTTEFKEAWADWIAYRKEIGHPLKPTTMKTQLKQLAGWGATNAVLSLRTSISRSWRGFFPPEQKDIDAAKPKGPAAPPPTAQEVQQARVRYKQRFQDSAHKPVADLLNLPQNSEEVPT